MDRLADGLIRAYGRWPTGTYLGWYPVKSVAQVDGMHRRLLDAGIGGLLAVDVFVRTVSDGPLPGAGLVVINPPWTLKDELAVLMPWFRDLLAQGAGAGFRLLPLAER